MGQWWALNNSQSYVPICSTLPCCASWKWAVVQVKLDKVILSGLIWLIVFILQEWKGLWPHIFVYGFDTYTHKTNFKKRPKIALNKPKKHKTIPCFFAHCNRWDVLHFFVLVCLVCNFFWKSGVSKMKSYILVFSFFCFRTKTVLSLFSNEILVI